MRKIVALILAIAMIVGVTTTLPQLEVKAATQDEFSNIKIYAEKSKEQIESLAGKHLTTVVADSTKASTYFEIWHYAGGFWADNLNNMTVKVNDEDFNKTEGGVADLKTALTLDYKTITYPIDTKSALYKSIKDGDTVHVVLSSGDKSIKLTSYYALNGVYNKATKEKDIATNVDGTLLNTDSTAKVVENADGSLKIEIKVKPILNYYSEKNLSYKKEYGLALNNWIPFVENGFGNQVYSIFKDGDHLGFAKGEVNQSNPTSTKDLETGSIHPLMIKDTTGALKKGYKIKVSGEKPGTYDSEGLSIGSGTFKSGGAVGQAYSFKVNLSIYTEPSAKVIKNYVQVKGVDKSGKLIYEQIKEPISERAEFYEGTTNVKINSLETIPEGTAILNDVLTSPKLLTPEKEIKWVDTTPKTAKAEIKSTATDISRHAFGIVTKEDEVVNAIKTKPDKLKLVILLKGSKLDFNVIKVPTEVQKSAVIKDIDKVDITGGTVKQGSTTYKIANANIVYSRYIVVPESKQINKISILKDNKIQKIIVTANRLPINEDPNGGYDTATTLYDLSQDIDGLKLKSWYTSDVTPIPDVSSQAMPTKTANSKSGNGPAPIKIEGLKTTENVYVEWILDTYSEGKEPVEQSVPEWRLSKYTNQLPKWYTAYMGLNLRADNGHASSTFSPTGTYNYTTVNPTYTNYLHSKTLTKGKYTISHEDTLKTVDVNANLNLIKSTDLSGIKLAKWLKQSNLTSYNLSSASKGASYKGLAAVKKSNLLSLGIKNKDIYTHNYGVYSHHDCSHTEADGTKWSHDVCGCYTLTEKPTPTYIPAEVKIDSTFARYKATSTDAKILKVTSVKSENNGKTTVAKQESTTLNVYPEYAMLFQNDSGAASIVYAVSDIARKIQPVTYNTMKYTVDFRATSTGTAQATAMAAKTTLASKGWGNIPVIYKGAGVNSTIDTKLSKGSNEKGILTVKTYALDVSTNVNGENLKSAWGNSSYNTATVRDNFLASFGAKDEKGNWYINGTATEQLQIDKLYPAVTNNIKLTEKPDARKQTNYKLEVRGGVLTKVNGTSLTSIKTSNPELYEALVGMKMIGANKDATVFKTYAHQTGAALTEQEFKTLAAKSRGVDNLSIGKGWYSEDSSDGVLIVTEYETVFELPISIGNSKIPMTIPGLATPVNKQLLYTQMLPGYLQINYTMQSKDMGNSLGVVKANVEHNTKADSAFGSKKVLYAVPNASTLDMFGY